MTVHPPWNEPNDPECPECEHTIKDKPNHDPNCEFGDSSREEVVETVISDER